MLPAASISIAADCYIEGFNLGGRVARPLPLEPPTRREPIVYGFIGASGSGKTTLIEKLLLRLTRAGLRAGALKHDAHRFQMDREGKDTWRFRRAGAYAVGIASKTERATISSTEAPLSLAELMNTLPGDLDVILVEGYRAEDVPKIEVHHRGLERLRPVEGVIALATDDPNALPVPGARRFHRDEADAIFSLLFPQLALDDACGVAID